MMSNWQRSLNYQRQEGLRINSTKEFQGMRDLTPAQQRRIRKARNKTRGRLLRLHAAYQNQIRQYAVEGLAQLDATAEKRLDWGAGDIVWEEKDNA